MRTWKVLPYPDSFLEKGLPICAIPENAWSSKSCTLDSNRGYLILKTASGVRKPSFCLILKRLDRRSSNPISFATWRELRRTLINGRYWVSLWRHLNLPSELGYWRPQESVWGKSHTITCSSAGSILKVGKDKWSTPGKIFLQLCCSEIGLFQGYRRSTLFQT